MADPSSEWRDNWRIVLAATAGMSIASLSTSSIGVMLIPIERDLGWTRTQISSGPMLISFTVILTGTLAGLAVERLGPRRIAIASVLLIWCAIAGMSRLGDSVWAWRGLWAMVGLASAAMPTVWLKPITDRFDAGRGLAIAVVLSGSGLSSTIVPLVATWLLERLGWREAYLVLACIWLAMVLPLVVCFLPGASARRRAPAEATVAGRVPESVACPTVRQGLSTPAFYMILLGAILSTFAGTALVFNLVPMLRANGLSLEIAASVVSFIGVSTIIGRVSGGWLMDRVPPQSVAFAASLLMILLPALLRAHTGTLPLLVGAIVIYGLAGGAMTPSIANIASRRFGPRAFATLYATVNAGFSLGVGFGPLCANYVFDTRRSYDPAYLLTIPLFVGSGVLFLLLPRITTAREIVGSKQR